MCEALDGDLDSFERSIGQLGRLDRRTYEYQMVDGEMDAHESNDPAYLARKDVCEKSRFVWFSTMQAAEQYCDAVLDEPGLSPEPRAQRVHRLFEQAVGLLSCFEDRFCRNVRDRRDELIPVLAKHLSVSTSPM